MMLAALTYSVLVAVFLEDLFTHKSFIDMRSGRSVARASLPISLSALALGTAVLLGFPTYTGVFVPDTKPTLASWAISARPTHVQMPPYWTDMARFADALPIEGAILVMPPDDWYEMPYTWYYGTDAFVVDLFKRRVLLPNAQGYSPASNRLIDSVNLTAESILHRDWRQTEALVTVLNSPLILVRRDIEAPSANHSILSPNDLAAALAEAPNFTLLKRVGSLDLYGLRGTVSATEVVSNFVTIESETPDLRYLSLLPPNTALVSGKPRAGVSSVVQAPALELWRHEDNAIVWQPAAPTGWAYRILEMDSMSVVSLDHAGTFGAPTSPTQVVYAPGTATNELKVKVIGRSAVSNGDFTAGTWGPVRDCNAAGPRPASALRSASVQANGSPGGQPVLRLSSSRGSACESQVLDWRGGSVLISLLIHPVEGAGPRICLWEYGPERCASLPDIPLKKGWSVYRASATPDAGTRALNLSLFADANSAVSRTTNEYADVRILEVKVLPTFALLADPVGQPTPPLQLVLAHSSFSPDWGISPGGDHVLVDGLLNGWLVPTGPQQFTTFYMPGIRFSAAGWMSLATAVGILLLSIWSLIAKLQRWKWGKPKTDEYIGDSVRPQDV
jgi:hypothetical protein